VGGTGESIAKRTKEGSLKRGRGEGERWLVLGWEKEGGDRVRERKEAVAVDVCRNKDSTKHITFLLFNGGAKETPTKRKKEKVPREGQTRGWDIPSQCLQKWKEKK